MNVMTSSDFATFAMCCGTTKYVDLVNAVKDFEYGIKSFRVSSNKVKLQEMQWQSAFRKVKPLVRPDACVQSMEAKIATLAHKLSSLSLII